MTHTTTAHRTRSAHATPLALASSRMEGGELVHSAHQLYGAPLVTAPAPREEAWRDPLFDFYDVAVLVSPATSHRELVTQLEALLDTIRRDGEHVLREHQEEQGARRPCAATDGDDAHALNGEDALFRLMLTQRAAEEGHPPRELAPETEEARAWRGAGALWLAGEPKHTRPIDLPRCLDEEEEVLEEVAMEPPRAFSTPCQQRATWLALTHADTPEQGPICSAHFVSGAPLGLYPYTEAQIVDGEELLSHVATVTWGEVMVMMRPHASPSRAAQAVRALADRLEARAGALLDSLPASIKGMYPPLSSSSELTFPDSWLQQEALFAAHQGRGWLDHLAAAPPVMVERRSWFDADEEE